MVNCNICRKNKDVEEMMFPFHYVCVECWNKMKFFINEEEINREDIY